MNSKDGTSKALNIMYRGERWDMAVNASTPPDVLNELATDEDKDIRKVVAGNANTAVEVLDRLAEDDNWGVRWAVAGNTNTRGEALNRLATDKETVNSTFPTCNNIGIYLFIRAYRSA